jgi:hypothetical protein
VEELGDFLELEVVMAEGEPAEVGVALAHDLFARLDISPGQLIEVAYVDLLRPAKEPARPAPGRSRSAKAHEARPSAMETPSSTAGSLAAESRFELSGQE